MEGSIFTTPTESQPQTLKYGSGETKYDVLRGRIIIDFVCQV